MITKVSQLKCDSCGAMELTEVPEPTVARIQAQGRGWKFMSYQGMVIKGKNRSRQWDSCPSCDLPQPAEVTERLTLELS